MSVAAATVEKVVTTLLRRGEQFHSYSMSFLEFCVPMITKNQPIFDGIIKQIKCGRF